MAKLYKLLVFVLALQSVSYSSLGQSSIIKSERKAPPGIVSFSETAKIASIGNSKHIDGYVRKYGDDIFTFPVGQNGVFRPFAAQADRTTGAYFAGTPSSNSFSIESTFSYDRRDGLVKAVGNKEFWDINGSKATRLTLSWNAASDVAGITDNDLKSLTIVGWNTSTSNWEKIESLVDEVSIFTAMSSDVSQGSITTIQSITPDTYSIYSFGSLQQANASSKFNGVLESVSCTEITGWVWDENHPNSVLNVELVEGTKIYASTSAGIFRQDLKTKGIGTGYHAFKFVVPSALLSDGVNHNLSVRVKGTSYLLNGSPKAFSCSYEGTFEGSDCYKISGWVRDKNNTNTALKVEIMDGNTILSTVVAEKYRADLKSKGLGTGNYGFSIDVPPSLKDGASHSLTVRVKGTTYVLTNSPQVVVCPGPSYDGKFERAECGVISGWVWDKSYPNSALVVELFEGNTVYATATANIFQESLQRYGIGTAKYGFSIATPTSLKDGKEHALNIRVKVTAQSDLCCQRVRRQVRAGRLRFD
ncbi:hypothetical protein [Dyadobacter sp. Leaf189]|uniref:hypothetical protein n=1 Tax=Dyadobacter sp. Leaf189 TaxID=1736295 RepID=UPI0006F2AF80|nr:hypothetical protein [Dyadobacter sp. Leaf189]KQS30684.1 hypothetical protein ASG33_09845 [Dyadobacter sp. Leaf189]